MSIGKAPSISGKWYREIFDNRGWPLSETEEIAFEIIQANPKWVKHCSQPWLDHIANGKKVVEGRLCKRDFKEMNAGDTIAFYNDKVVVVTIKGMKHYCTFTEYLEKEGLERCLPGVDTIEQGVQIYRQFFTEEDEFSYGVMALEVEVL